MISNRIDYLKGKILRLCASQKASIDAEFIELFGELLEEIRLLENRVAGLEARNPGDNRRLGGSN